jgi:hypothetical protein
MIRAQTIVRLITPEACTLHLWGRAQLAYFMHMLEHCSTPHGCSTSTQRGLGNEFLHILHEYQVIRFGLRETS